MVGLLSSCGVSDDPQLTMCQSITRTLAGDISAFKTAPQQVVLNGEKIGARDLLAASGKSTVEAIKKVSKETAQQGKTMADDVTKKAEEVTEQAGNALREIEKQAADVATELGGKAKRIAEETAGEVKEAINK